MGKGGFNGFEDAYTEIFEYIERTTTENADIRQSATKYLNCLSKNGMLRKLLVSLVNEL